MNMDDLYEITKRVYKNSIECLSKAMEEGLKKCGFTKDYYSRHNEEFKVWVSPTWPYAIDYLKGCLDLPISKKYCMYHLGKRLFEIDEIYKYKDEANKNGLYFECTTKFYDEGEGHE